MWPPSSAGRANPARRRGLHAPVARGRAMKARAGLARASHRLFRGAMGRALAEVGPPPGRKARARPHVLSGEDIGPEVLKTVMQRLLARAERVGERWLEEVAYETLYAEQSRLAHAGPDLPPGLDPEFVARLRRELAQADAGRFPAIVHEIVDHYVREIGGHFDPRVYRFASRWCPRRS